MENNKAVVIPVVLKGPNYLLWASLVKTSLGGRGLWSHVTNDRASKPTAKEGDKEIVLVDEEKWNQEDMMVLSIIQGSLDASILESYYYCEKVKDLWNTLKKVYGNISNLSRVFEIK